MKNVAPAPVRGKFPLWLQRASAAAFALFVSLFASFPGTGAADQVRLKNGDRLTGEVIRLNEDEIVLKSPILGELTIPWSQIAGWEGRKSARITLQDGKELEGSLERFEADAWVVRPDDGETVRIARSAARELEVSKTERERWSGKLSAGAALQSGNTDSFGVNFRAEVSRRTRPDRLTFLGEYQRTEDQDDLTTDKGRLLGRYDHLFTDRFFTFGLLNLETDRKEELALRHTESAGPGYFFIKNRRTELSGEVGLSHIQEIFRDGRSRSDLAGRAAVAWEQKIWKSTLSVKGAYQPKLHDPETDFLVNGEIVFSTPLTGSLVFDLIATDEYDNDPEPGVEKNDASFKLNLGVRF
ncbi:MAG: DUF481 domain-containing protein [Candidatus Tectomicrobia bacterium]|nr:DUF481 domain-containing protein [Candidatus Tectomicrobia bacterium]